MLKKKKGEKAMRLIQRYIDDNEGAEYDCPDCSGTAIMTDDGGYCPDCG